MIARLAGALELAGALALSWLLAAPTPASAACDAPAHAVEAENCLQGTPRSIWDTAGDPSIEGFATDISVNRGEAISFKVRTRASEWFLEIYRMGWYGGAGARRVAEVLPSVPLPQRQPACLEKRETGLVDCSGWAVSATWQVPRDAVSGIYFARAVRTDTGGSSHIVFVVRDDGSRSDILFQTADTTWQAYNSWGGNSLYTGEPAGRAYEVSYDRPFNTREVEPETWVFNAEYPMVRWLERNGYDVTYHAGVDADRLGHLIANHRVWMSNGHDEYWSERQWAHVEAARDAGVHLAFFSGNKVFWRIRWEASLAGSRDSHRTMVCYKDTLAGEVIDPSGRATGTWRDGRFGEPGRPENELTGSIFLVNGPFLDTITVPAEDGKMRFWRDTRLADLSPGEVARLTTGTLGAEVDVDLDNGFRPPGLFGLSTTDIVTDHLLLQDEGSVYGAGAATHRLTLYRHQPGGALVFSTGTYQWAWGLDPDHDRSELSSGVDPAMQQATVNLLADMGVQPASLQQGLRRATPSTDLLPPTSTITSPHPGTLHPATQPLFVTGRATDFGGGVVGGVEVSLDGGATWREARGREHWSYEAAAIGCGTYDIRVRAVDDSGNLEAPRARVVVTVGDGGACHTCTLFAQARPTIGDAGPSDPVEIGMTFYPEADGLVHGLRFWKSAANRGPHHGHLWTAEGELLGALRFGTRLREGWQRADFDRPIPVQAGRAYVASYHTEVGHHAADPHWSGRSAPPLHAPVDGATARGRTVHNGLAAHGPRGTFPGRSASGANHWVDIVFSRAAPEAMPPSSQGVLVAGDEVAGTDLDTDQPAAPGSAEGSDGHRLAAIVVGPEATLHPGARWQLQAIGRLQDGTPVPIAGSFRSSAPQVVTVDPAGLLVAHGAGAATIVVTAEGVEGRARVEVVAPPAAPAPGGPILVIRGAANPWSDFLPEILRAEGFASFEVADLGQVDRAVLDRFALAVLGALPLSDEEADLLSDWVEAGGLLVALRPDARLEQLLGLRWLGRSLAEGYLRVDAERPPGAGIAEETLQFHGVADRYALAGASEIARLHESRHEATDAPAVTLRQVGKGAAAAFAFDLARSIVLSRQGNPDWAGQRRDGREQIRSHNLFTGRGRFWLRENWVDPERIHIPQADEVQRLFANLLLELGGERMPLPRFWYLPAFHKAVVVMTGDDHANAETIRRYEDQLAASPPGCSVEDWECVRSTSYVWVQTPHEAEALRRYDALGFETALHVDTGCADWSSPQALESIYREGLSRFAAAFPGLPPPVTNRTHCIVWSDWDSQPKVSQRHGIRLDTNYYYWPPEWVGDRPGFMTGSATPMRFVDGQGRLLDVYQVATHMTDESEQRYPHTIDALLDGALGPSGFYGVFTANMHTDFNPHPESEAIVRSAQARQVPVISARQLLTWLDGRNASAFLHLRWGSHTLAFDVQAASGARGLHAMVPLHVGAHRVASVTKDDASHPFFTERIKGVDYAIFEAPTGSYSIAYVPAGHAGRGRDEDARRSIGEAR